MRYPKLEIIRIYKGSDEIAQTSINIRMHESLKKDMKHRMPFEVSVDPFYGGDNIKAIDESIEQIKQGKVVVKTMQELEDAENE